MTISRDDVLKANVELHSKLSTVYKETEPHYRPENRAKVSKTIKDLCSKAGNERLLDVGCGMGFIIDLAKEHVNQIDGIDITEAMLGKVDCSSCSCDINVQIAEIESAPFEDESFNLVTAYAVLHHLHELKPAFQEIYRVLKPGGVFYSDTDPNYYFWEAMKNLAPDEDYSAPVQREIDAVTSKDKELEEKFGVDPILLNTAEVLKHDSGGFKAEELTKELYEIGFSKVDVSYEWYVGEARVIHSDDTVECAASIRMILNELLPLTKHLFKYLKIVAEK